MYQYWYDYIKQKYSKLCYMNSNSFIINIKTQNFYEDIADVFGRRLGTSNYEVDRPLSKGKIKKKLD